MSLKIKNLKFKLNHQDIYFFKNLNLNLDSGKLGFIKGVNGIGKSTLFRAIAGKIGLSEECSGGVIVNQQALDLANQRDQILEKVIIMPKKYNEILASSFTFNQNLALSKISSFPSLNFFRSDNIDDKIIQRLKINPALPVSCLSEGQKQILAIKIMLLKQPQVLLLDEPTATLDEANARYTLQFIKDLVCELKINILIICHQNHLIDQYADEIFELQLSLNPESNCLIELKR